MSLDTVERQNIVYFTGYEVEHTICHGMFTLFVVGTPPVEEILSKAKETGVKHIYFGTSQSFPDINVNDAETWKVWETTIKACLDEDFWCTLDLDSTSAQGLLEGGLCEKSKFIPMISVKLPYVQQLGYNATIKIDDHDFDRTNAGVWCHSLHDLMDRNKFTSWDKYTKDETL